MRILGHRGASHDFPENTLEAILGAQAQGADGIECDVMKCATGELVLCHDENLLRLAGQNIEVAKTPWNILKSIDVGSSLGFGPARIPLLSDVYDAVKKDFALNLEIKCDHFDDAGLAVDIAQFLTQRNEYERTFVSSFNPWCLLKLAAANPKLKRGLLIDPDRNIEFQLETWAPLTCRTSIHVHFLQVTKELMQQWHQNNWQVAVWTVDDAQVARELVSMGVDDVITNRPMAMRSELRKLSQSY
jgi:glycerophosphoryl diester phosphodiesterase